MRFTSDKWASALQDVLNQSWWLSLCNRVDFAYEHATCFPRKTEIFDVFNRCNLEQVKVVILGQDPYHGAGQAHGLAFSVRSGVKAPPSLRNILKEVWDDVNGMPVVDLTRWADQGVLLLNAVLTVEEKKPGSHSIFGWELFTDEVVRHISNNKEHVVFMLWGNYAQKKENLIDTSKHLVLKAPHPSPLSAYQGFFGCKHFSQANDYMRMHGCSAIEW